MDCFAFSLKPQEAMIERKYEITQRPAELLLSLVNAMLAGKPRIREVSDQRRGLILLAVPRRNPRWNRASPRRLSAGQDRS
jgi:hypothetical protein